MLGAVGWVVTVLVGLTGPDHSEALRLIDLHRKMHRSTYTKIFL